MNSLTPPRKRHRTEYSNGVQDWSVELSGVEQTMPCSDNSLTVNVGDIRFAEMLMKKSQKIGTWKEEIGLYAVPLTRSTTKIGQATLNRFVFEVGAVDENPSSLEEDTTKDIKTILLLGAPDSGKTLIDSLFNFIVGVALTGTIRSVSSSKKTAKANQSLFLSMKSVTPKDSGFCFPSRLSTCPLASTHLHTMFLKYWETSCSLAPFSSLS